MPVDRMIGRYDKELKKVVWTMIGDEIPERVSPAVEGVKEIRAVGLPGQPTFSSRKSYERAVREAGCVVVGNDPAAMAPGPQREKHRLTEPGKASKRAKV